MPDYTHSSPIGVIPHTQVVHPDTVQGGDQTGGGKLGVLLTFFHGFFETAVNTNSGRFIVQISANSSGDDSWATVTEYVTIVSTPDDIDPTNAEAIGQTVIETTDTTGFVAGDYCYFDLVSIGDGEWCLVQEVAAGSSVTLIDGLSLSHANTDLLRNDAQTWTFYLDLAGVARYRVLFLHEGAVGANVAVMVLGVEVLAIV
jgi:hypothetical protein